VARSETENHGKHIDERPDGVMNSASPRPVVIVGMHRSGTSMVAKLLQQAGLHLGDESVLMPPAEENSEGFYEHLGFVSLNDEVLNAAGAGWDCPPPPGVDWTGATFDAFRGEARSLAAPLATAGAWGWKDPRTSLTLPFWESAIGPLRTVVVVRNPLEVVTSLHRRNGFSPALGLTLWRTYMERILADTSAEHRMVTHYDAYFLHPEQEIARVLDFSGLDRPVDPATLRATTAPALRHHQRTILDLDASGFPTEAIALYRCLCREAGWWEGTTAPDVPVAESPEGSTPAAPSIARGIGRVDLVRVENEALRRNNSDFTAALAARELRVTELEIALATHEATRAELDGKIAERDSRLIERNALIARRDHAIAEGQQHLAHATAEVSRLQDEIAKLTDRLADSERARTVSVIHERELRSMLTGLQAIQMGRDAEIMGTLGAVLSRHAPGAPASIYHRRLLGEVRRFVDEHIPVDAPTLVATYGDGAMLVLGDRPTGPFPRAASGTVADYTDPSDAEAVAQLEELREGGAAYLVVPSPSLPWLSGLPGLELYLQQRCTPVARERGIGAIFALGRQSDDVPA